MIDTTAGFVMNQNITNETEIIIDEPIINEPTGSKYRVTLADAPFAKYADQFEAYLTDDAFDESVNTECVPDSGGFYLEDKYMDPFACYFRNIQMTDFGDYKTLKRDECKNDACRICDQFFNELGNNQSNK